MRGLFGSDETSGETKLAKINPASYDTECLEKIKAHSDAISAEIYKLRQKHILILEDEDLGRRTFEHLLSSIDENKIEFDLVASLDEAEAKMKEVSYDFFILDMRLKKPGTSWRTIDRGTDCGLSLVERHPEIAEKTIIWSGYMTSSLRVRAGKLKVAKILDKTAQIIEDFCEIVEELKGSNLKFQLMNL